MSRALDHHDGDACWESRCAVVSAIEAGMSLPLAQPAAVAACCRIRPRRSGRCRAVTAARGCPGRSVRPARRYERAQPGELLHVDTKKLGLQPTSTAQRARGPAPISRISHLRRPDT
jgi:hypothetical protein